MPRSGRPPSLLLRGLMDALFLRTLQPDRAGGTLWPGLPWREDLSRCAHGLRMPLLLPAQHLTRKALRREEEKAGWESLAESTVTPDREAANLPGKGGVGRRTTE